MANEGNCENTLKIGVWGVVIIEIVLCEEREMRQGKRVSEKH